MPDQPPYCDFCFNSNVPLYEAVFEPTVHIRANCAAQAVALTTPQSQPPPTIQLTREQRLALVPTPKSLVAHLDQHVIGQGIAKQRIAVGVSNHFKRIVDSIEPDDPIVTDADLKNVRIEKSNILLIGPFGLGKSHLVRFPGFLSERAPGRQ